MTTTLSYRKAARPAMIPVLAAVIGVLACEPADETARTDNVQTAPGAPADMPEGGGTDAGLDAGERRGMDTGNANDAGQVGDGGRADTSRDADAPDGAEPPAGGADDAVAVIHAYYNAIDAGDYRRAYD